MKELNGSSLIRAVTLQELHSAIGGPIRFEACVHKVRRMSTFSFVLLRTGRYVFQSVHTPQDCAGSIDDIKEGCYVEITGQVREDKRAAYGVEIVLQAIKLLSRPAEEYPLRVSDKRLGCNIDTNLKYRSVALRNPMERAVFKISEGVCRGFAEFMLGQNFTEIHSPKLVASGAEGGANIFRLKYFGRDAYLAQSPQFYKQSGVAIFDRVFEVAPVYRAEKHSSTRHLNEYIGLDFEMAYIRDMYDVMNMETAMLKSVIAHLKEHYSHELDMLKAQLPVIESIPSVTFLEALELVGANGRNAHDLEPEDEVKLCEYAKKQWNSEFVFVTHYPSAKRPFYAMDNKDDPRLAESFDLLFRGLEITTGGQRVHEYDAQVEKMRRFGLDPQDFESFLDIHRYGMPPHGGLGIGLERLVMKLLNLSNVRQASLFPRDMTHLEP